MKLDDGHVNQIAERAYTIYRTRYPQEPTWGNIPNQYAWRDTALAFIRNPHPKTRPSGGMEESIAIAIAVATSDDGGAAPTAPASAPVITAPAGKPAEKPAEKPSKTAPKKPAKH